MAQFTYVTEDWIIKDIKKLALDKDIHARDILDICYMIVSAGLTSDSDCSDIIKKGFDDYITLVKNDKIKKIEE